VCPVRRGVGAAVTGCDGNDLNDSHTDWITESGQVSGPERECYLGLQERVDEHRRALN
jgi:hypothetical protein